MKLLMLGDCNNIGSTSASKHLQPKIQVMNNSTDNISLLAGRPIETFVFLDLETSGLGSTRNRITELAMLAVSRSDIEKMEKETSNKRKRQMMEHHDANLTEKNMLTDNIRSVRKRLFNDHSEEKVDGTYHPFHVDTRLKTLRPGHMTQKTEEHPKENGTVNEVSHIEADAPAVTSLKTQNQATQTVRFSTSHYHPVPKLPRIVQKLSKIFNPKVLIFPETEEISGLNNIMLEKSAQMNSDFCEVFLKFLDFPKPICIVGHNSLKFDFPIVMSEFLSVTNCQFRCPDIFCTDSLIIFKALDKIQVLEEINACSEDIARHLDWFLDDEVFQQISLENNKENVTSIDSNGEPNVPCAIQINDETEQMSAIPCTPVKNSNISFNSSLAPDTPVTPSHKDPQENTTSGFSLGSIFASPPATPRHNVESASKPIMVSPPTMTKGRSFSDQTNDPSLLTFPPNCSFKSKVLLAKNDPAYNLGFKPSQRPFSQPVLYQRLFGCRYEAHRAESDCEALLKIAGHYGTKFTLAADVLKIDFNSVKPAWRTNKMIQSEHFQQA
ncbi:uncharacterized protein LOC108674970 [Hyalella azteca]|uniref:Uncharacterized protein LOC108674970 n=1 Tax=Hyalella azteca TaxID=294128 RepID=A0A8B7NXM4_HYAAZ|nr:uncharacterized protein LOC108674970 [Hyalella azteca]